MNITLNAILIKFKHKLGHSIKLILIVHIFIAFLINSNRVLAQDSIPSFTAWDLNDKEINISHNITGKKSLVGFAFSQKSQEDLESWIQPVYDEFIDENSLASLVYDVDVYLVIVFNSINSKFKQRVEKELKENILEEFFDNVLLCDEKASSIKEFLDITDDSIPILFAIDENGWIKERKEGRYTEKKLELLSNHLEIE